MSKTFSRVLLVIAILALIGFGIMAYKYNSLTKNNNYQNNASTTTQNQISTSTNISTSVVWNTYNDFANKMSIKYPSLNGIDLKPIIATTSKKDLNTNGCVPGQDDSGSINKDVVLTINGVNFCGSESTGAGMSHHYNYYYYTFLHKGVYYTLTYDASTVACGVYGDSNDPGYQGCEIRVSSLISLIPLIQQSLLTLTFN